MLNGRKQAIRSLLIVGYSEVLTKVRRSVKGIRIAYLFSVQIVGNHPGIRLKEFCDITGRNRSNAYESLLRCINAGLIHKDNKRYYLTERGQMVDNAIRKEFDVSMNVIISELVKEAARRSDLG
jgi:DNA-binding IclR family transcriptional regulator